MDDEPATTMSVEAQLEHYKAKCTVLKNEKAQLILDREHYITKTGRRKKNIRHMQDALELANLKLEKAQREAEAAKAQLAASLRPKMAPMTARVGP